jgi:PIN domain nuclease of toxin-antitoxin system
VRTLLDANALVALLLGERGAEAVVRILREGQAAMTAANIAEVFDIALRSGGSSTARVAEVVEPLFGGPIEPVNVDADIARRAGEIRSEHYHRTKQPVSLGDVILLAAARPEDRIATADSGVLVVATELGIETIELPPSH